ncbi:uracil-DNA glycosylase [Opitutaceae bacterium EW11]|nr:uracil-DNA glycosylase [Opitutaceae bacterium EW11]
MKKPRAAEVELELGFSAAPVPASREWKRLRDAAKSCQACPLWRNATCTVFGEGPVHARVMLVGEQPGDQEDRAGKPFVGPAGHLLDRALAEAGLQREELYVTNAVKHFKWTSQGKRRLHAKPNAREMAACRPWLAAEVEAIEPELIVCLGATAAQQVIDKSVRVTASRGKRMASAWGTTALVTVHPSSLLRHHGSGDPEAEFEAFVADLRKISRL